MSFNRPFCSPQRIALVRELYGIRKSELSMRLGVSARTVTCWELGLQAPSAGDVAALCRVFGVGPEFFEPQLEGLPVASGLPHFRSYRAGTQVAYRQAQAYVQVTQDLVRTLRDYVDFPALHLPDISADPELAESIVPQMAAQYVRHVWGLGDGPIAHVLREVENHGVCAVFAPFEHASLDAYSVFGGGVPLIVLNPTVGDYYRQRFDVAHELGHLVMHPDAEPGNKVIEAQADAFASELLAPSEVLHDELPTRMDGAGWLKLKELKERWGVSMKVLLDKAYALGRLTEEGYRAGLKSLSRNGWKLLEPGAISGVEEPSLIPHALELLGDVGVSPEEVRERSRVPQGYFGVMAARRPLLPVRA
ncbi:MAG: ImmA/IrrE family metallo-endopeptidase [Rothia mucilaginosa]|uniref:ImmA/IrrE family metallo-endopeptidase n=1 Tax=Rothia mucilaginosa TaxID=43675 RepID=A0A930L1E1_9MICC|nr:ImmA/IrrE family metallo-endopeptidase [Rothia mucilaginosa]